MISSTTHTAAYFNHRHAARHDMRERTRAMAIHAAESTWAGAARALKLVGVSIVVVPIAPVGMMMWLAAGMQRGRQIPVAP